MRSPDLDGGSGARTVAPNSFWLRHIYPERNVRQPYDVTVEVLQERLEVQVTGIAARINAEHGVGMEAALPMAASILMNECVALHRLHSPLGHRAMVFTLLGDDPLLMPERVKLATAMAVRARSAFRGGVLMGLSIAAAFYAAWTF